MTATDFYKSPSVTTPEGVTKTILGPTSFVRDHDSERSMTDFALL
jgi:hypothetical protein